MSFLGHQILLKQSSIAALLVAILLLFAMCPTSSSETSIFEAARDGDIERLKQLIDAGENVNQETVGWSPLAIAVDKGQDLAVAMLIDHGADTEVRDERGRTLLHHAVYKSSFITKRLLDAAVDVNARDNYGNTALNFAAAGQNEEIFNLLLAHGADVNLQGNRETTALMAATMNNHIARIVRLIDMGADVNARDADGKTALFFAAGRLARPDTVRVLLEGGALANIEDHHGNSPLGIAQQILGEFLESEGDTMRKAERGELFATTPEDLRQIKFDYQEVVSLLTEAGAQ